MNEIENEGLSIYKNINDNDCGSKIWMFYIFSKDFIRYLGIECFESWCVFNLSQDDLILDVVLKLKEESEPNAPGFEIVVPSLHFVGCPRCGCSDFEILRKVNSLLALENSFMKENEFLLYVKEDTSLNISNFLKIFCKECESEFMFDSASKIKDLIKLFEHET